MNTKLMAVIAITGLSLAACGSGTSASSTPFTPTSSYKPTPVPSNGNNLHIQVSPGSTICGSSNIPCVTVTICQPGTTSCDTIDNILLDTGSFGLRVFGSLLNNSLTPMESNGKTVAECVTYGDGTSNWGPVEYADIKLNNITTTTSIPIQVLDANFIGMKTYCPNASTTPAVFGINGVLGVGPLQSDEGLGGYFTCDNSGCSPLDTPPAYVLNLITRFSTGNNNGLTLNFAPVPLTGASGADGYAVFGVGTNPSNTPAANTVFNVFQIKSSDEFPMNVTTAYASNTYNSYLDTGSNFLFFDQQFFPDCGGENEGFFCPTNNVPQLAQMIGTNGLNSPSSTNINFNIGNVNGLFSTDNTAFSNVGSTFEGLNGVLDWGLPFYLGKTVYMIFAGSTATINGVTYPASPKGYWIY